MARGTLTALCFAALFLAASAQTLQEKCKNEQILIGGPGGWAPGVNATWKQPEIRVGDNLTFPSSGEGLHTVFLFDSPEDYAACNFSSARFMGNVPVTWKVKHGGFYLFACDVPGHCEAGQKLNITVFPDSKECRRMWRDMPHSPPPAKAKAPTTAKGPTMGRGPSTAKAPLPSAAKRPPPPTKAAAPAPAKGKAPAPQAKPPPPAGAAPAPSPGAGAGSECLPKVVLVGGSTGWTFFIDTSWQPPVIYEGDFLRFNWTGDVQHTVYQLTSADSYANCDFKDARLLGEKTNVVTGPLPAPKTLYFACSSYGHCGAGQKVALSVVKRPATCNLKAA